MLNCRKTKKSGQLWLVRQGRTAKCVIHQMGSFRLHWLWCVDAVQLLIHLCCIEYSLGKYGYEHLVSAIQSRVICLLHSEDTRRITIFLLQYVIRRFKYQLVHGVIGTAKLGRLQFHDHHDVDHSLLYGLLFVQRGFRAGFPKAVRSN